MPGAMGSTGTRASANTSGPDFTQATRRPERNCGPGTADPHRTKKTCFFCGTGFEVLAPQKLIQPFDLMSRRHPLSSVGALRIGICSLRSEPTQRAPMTRRPQMAGDVVRRDLLLLGDLAGLLRSLLHCALRLLLRFLSHSALRCEMAYSLRAFGNRNALHSEYTNTWKKTVSRLRKC